MNTRCFAAITVISLAAFSHSAGAADPEKSSGNRHGEHAFEALTKKYKARKSHFLNQYQAAQTEEARTAVIRDLDPANTLIVPFFDLEEAHRGSIVGLSALYHCIANGASRDPETPASKARREAMQLVMDHYHDCSDLDYVIRIIGERTVEEKALLSLADTHLEPRVRAMALFNRASRRRDEAELQDLDAVISLLAERAAQNKAELDYLRKKRAQSEHINPLLSREAALEAIGRVLSEYSEVLMAPRVGATPVLLSPERPIIDPLTKRPRRTFGEVAKSIQFELTRLSIGSVAPEISGPDAFGIDLSLHEQRGKVVVLMFSFKGCGPCERMYPDNRKLIELYTDRPFAFLGVMGDETIRTVKQAVNDGKITWPVWWDGGFGGPIATRWNVAGWPDTTVIDHRGVICYRGVRGAALAIAVQKLVIDAEKSACSGSEE